MSSTADHAHSTLTALGLAPGVRAAVFHADDVGMCHGANRAFAELSAAGGITCGAVMVPCPWFMEAVRAAQADPDLDLGVHLTLTSEWRDYRWGPVSTRDPRSGLVDDQGCFWPRLPVLARHLVPEAAEVEMRAQIEMALASGLDVTHLDTHMGVAFLPDLFEIYLRLGQAYQLPVLLPRSIAEYTRVLGLDDAALGDYPERIAGLEAAGLPVMDHFRMTPGVPTAAAESAYRELVATLPPGLAFVALHPTRSGEIEAIVPPKAHFRTDEYRLFGSHAFLNFIDREGIVKVGFRRLREIYRRRQSQT